MRQGFRDYGRGARFPVPSQLSSEKQGSPNGQRCRPEVPDDAFPVLEITVLALVMGMHSFAFVSLFPYVGIMVTGLLHLETTNEAGECGADQTARDKWYGTKYVRYSLVSGSGSNFS